MRRPHNSSGDHPSADELAAFVDRTIPSERAGRIRAHLDGCPDCMEAYQFALRSPGAAPMAPGPHREDLETVLSHAFPAVERGKDLQSPQRRWMRGRRFAYATAGVFVAVLSVLAALTLERRGDSPRFDPDSPEMRPITLAMVSSTEQRPLVMPGIELRLEGQNVTLRSGAPSATKDFDAAMSTLVQSYKDGDLSDAGIRWIVGGYLAVLQIDNARAFIDNARPRMQDDPDFLVLEAILAYHENDLVSARRILRSVVEDHPHHAVAAYDLAVVLDASGDQEGARALLEKLRSAKSGSPIAARATRMVEGMESD